MNTDLTNALSLKLNPEQLDAFCKKILSRSRNTANSHEALIVLEAFISTFATDSHGSEPYKQLQARLKIQSEKTRAKLMQEKTQQIQQALLTKNISQLASVYNSLSRNGFYQILSDATGLIERNDIPDIAHWVINWSETAKQKAEQASGYPDALDFKKAHINIEDYQTMSDISYFFNHTYQKN